MESYYLEQANNGSSIQSFSGVRYQRGGGFFSTLFTSKVLPILRYLGEKALSTGQAILGDVKTSATNRVIDAVQEVAREAIKRKIPTEKTQTGEGIKRRKISKRSYIDNYDFLK